MANIRNMEAQLKSIRPFIGAKNFEISSAFYRDLGFQVTVLEPKLSVFVAKGLSFYLQDYYAKDWVDNTMVFMEVEDVDQFYQYLLTLSLPAKYKDVSVSTVQIMDWGRVCYVHDPSGILWHFGQFSIR